MLYVPLTVMAVALALWAIVGDERRGFAAALVSAMLVAPFTLMYQASILLVAVRPALAVAPGQPAFWRWSPTRGLGGVPRLGGRGPGEPGPLPAARSAIDAVTAGVRQLSPAGVLALVGIAIGATILVLGLGSWPGTYYTLIRVASIVVAGLGLVVWLVIAILRPQYRAQSALMGAFAAALDRLCDQRLVRAGA